MTLPTAHSFEFLLGLPNGFLQQQGEWSLQFNPAWPGQAFIGVPVWNLTLAGLTVLLVAYVYTRDARSKPLRVALGVMRCLIFAVVLFLLNRPVLTLGQSRTEPSVLAIMVDDSSSMRVPDVRTRADPQSRLDAVKSLLSSHNAELLRQLSRRHNLRLYSFDRDATPIGEVSSAPMSSKQQVNLAAAVSAIDKLNAERESTQVVPSILHVMQDLQGQQVAGVVLLTDGRDTPAHNISDGLDALKNYGAKIFPVCVGSDEQPKNIQLQAMSVDDVAFKGDVVNVKALVRANGYEPNHAVELVLKDKKTGLLLPRKDGQPARTAINLTGDRPVEVELQWQTSDVGNREIMVEAIKQPGEIDDTDNSRSAPVSVLEAKISVLFVDGYPRWITGI